MLKLNNMRIGQRLGMGFGLLIVMMLSIVAVALLRFNDVSAINNRIIEKDWVKADAANIVNATTRANARLSMQLLITEDTTQITRIQADINTNKKAISDALNTLDQLVYLPQGRQLLAQLKQAREQYGASFTQVANLVKQGERAQANALMLSETLPRLDALQSPITQLTALQKKVVQQSSQELQDQLHAAGILMLTIGTMGALSGAAFAWWVTRSITRPISQAVTLAKTVAAGDLSSPQTDCDADECGQLLQALHDMNGSLIHIVTQVREGTASLATATSQIASGNMDLSSRTEEQASALEETAASMEQLTATVKHNFESGVHANNLAETASEVAVRGGSVVSQMVHTMEAIHESSTKIADIIGVIDGIAFQTNILALNAAVEAARAGEQGRGFAVVASEVRSLAGRSALAAKEIKELIGDSVGNVKEGCQLVEQAGSTMDEIVVHVRRVADLMREITTASKEQSLGIEQVNEAVSQMDMVTQQNAALVEESAAAAKSIEHQADQLLQTVSTFKLEAANRLSYHAPLAIA
ncbi:MAG: methyl-accepting chemotaxis protein [Pseudomonadota bacterium]